MNKKGVATIVAIVAIVAVVVISIMYLGLGNRGQAASTFDSDKYNKFIDKRIKPTTTLKYTTTTLPSLPDCKGTPTIEPNNSIMTLPPNVGVQIPVFIDSLTGGTFDEFISDNGVGGEIWCGGVLSNHCVFNTYGDTYRYIYYIAPINAPEHITITYTLEPHSMGYTCSWQSYGGQDSNTYLTSYRLDWDIVDLSSWEPKFIHCTSEKVFILDTPGVDDGIYLVDIGVKTDRIFLKESSTCLAEENLLYEDASNRILDSGIDFWDQSATIRFKEDNFVTSYTLYFDTSVDLGEVGSSEDVFILQKPGIDNAITINNINKKTDTIYMWRTNVQPYTNFKLFYDDADNRIQDTGIDFWEEKAFLNFWNP